MIILRIDNNERHKFTSKTSKRKIIFKKLLTFSGLYVLVIVVLFSFSTKFYLKYTSYLQNKIAQINIEDKKFEKSEEIFKEIKEFNSSISYSKNITNNTNNSILINSKIILKILENSKNNLSINSINVDAVNNKITIAGETNDQRSIDVFIKQLLKVDELKNINLSKYSIKNNNINFEIEIDNKKGNSD